MDDRSAAERERYLAGARELARISAAHPLNGFDRNVLRDWEQRRFSGPRPRLSFEFQAEWQQAIDAENAEIRQESERAAQYRAELLAAQIKAKAEREAHEQWRRDNPVLAAQEDVKEQERIAANAERYRQQQELRNAELKEQERLRDIQRTARFEGPQHLDGDDFLLWCETIATPEELEAFDAACVARAMRQHRPGLRFWDLLCELW